MAIAFKNGATIQITGVPVVAGIPTIKFGAVHLGGSVSQAVTITNIATVSFAGLDVAVGSLGGTAIGSGTVVNLSPGASDMADFLVGLNTGTVGAMSGVATFAAASDFGNGTTSALTSPTIDVLGTVYQVASATVTAPPQA